MFGYQPNYRYANGTSEPDSLPWWAKLLGMKAPAYRQAPRYTSSPDASIAPKSVDTRLITRPTEPDSK